MADPVIAKFRLTEIMTRLNDFYENGKMVPKKVVTLTFYPVGSGGEKEPEENKKFWAFTPSGKIELGTVNQEAVNQFELRKEYYVTFQEAPPPASTS